MRKSKRTTPASALNSTRSVSNRPSERKKRSAPHDGKLPSKPNRPLPKIIEGESSEKPAAAGSAADIIAAAQARAAARQASPEEQQAKLERTIAAAEERLKAAEEKLAEGREQQRQTGCTECRGGNTRQKLEQSKTKLAELRA